MTEDAVPESTAYRYAWSKDDADPEMTLDQFVKQFKPSMVDNSDGTKPWIWVCRKQPERVKEDEALKEGSKILQELTARVEEIKNDDAIPARSSKKTGLKGKKEVREEAQAETTKKLQELAKKTGLVSGKWLSFAAGEKVDMIWSQIAKSVIEGPLSKTAAFGAKVATSSGDTSQHLICVYVPDVFDKDAITEVMQVLLEEHGLFLSGVKSNLYTMLKIDSKHPSGLQSTTWKNAQIISDDKAKELRQTYWDGGRDASKAYKEKQEKKKAAAENAASSSKPQLKKKQADEDMFGDDDEEEEEDEEAAARKAALKAKTKKAPAPPAAAKKRAKVDSDDEDEDEPKKKKPASKTAKKAESDDEEEAPAPKKKPASKKAAPKKRAKADSEDDEEEDEPPKKKRAGRK
ncbi:hypothetical protein HMN09_01027600 [Mycena chlorophos]|uniref:Uncharacterized protein n=1 Tax=Mycena chlorophos TaxID=658473 RepID=A0A8H6SEL6_MYCCL|nr:hypothetical protein HMN09_01027600 [Mycena chlorophos]